jgi:RND family efflux transporter MFP subunit
MNTLSRLAIAGMLSISIAVLAGVSGCQKPPPAVAKTKDPEVEIEKPITRNVTDHEDFTGHIEADPIVDLRAQVTGYLKATHFKEGNDIKQGDLLFEIDSTVYDAELVRAKALVTQAEARYDRLTSDYNRVIRVVDKGTVTQEEIDRIRGDRAEALAAIGVAKAGQTIAEQNVTFTRITAPISGRIGKRKIDPNNLVKANDTVLATIVSLDPIYASFDIDERTILRLRRLIKEGRIVSARVNPTKVYIGLADEENHSITGVIDYIDPQLEAGTGTLRVRAKVENVKLDHSPGMLLSPGMFVRIRLPVGNAKPALLVREEALGSDQGQRYVYALNEKDEVVYRAVTLGPQDGRLRVIEKGLSADDRVIVRGLQRVRPGVKVTAKPAEPLP